MDANIYKGLIRKYLDGECTPDEAIRVERYLKREDAGEALKQLLDEDWHRFDEGYVDEKVLQQWQKKFSEKVNASGKRRYLRFPCLAQAAIWLLLAGVGFFYQNRQHKASTPEEVTAYVEQQQVETKRGQRTEVRLPDGTVIHLGPESSLRFAKNFNSQDCRTIELSGEAFFDVHPNPQKPFIIYSGGMETSVLGTSFKVDARPDRPYMVQVATGKVRVSRTSPDSLALAELTPGEVLAYETETAAIRLSNVDGRELAAWTDGKAVFDDISTADLAREMERWYDVDVSIADPTIADHGITIALSWKDPLEKSLKAMRAATGFNYTIQDRKITLHR